ncbi:MAG TPA: HEAT repeat domain-containing protein [Pirellulales bacterium]|nr:HEAT repeat domain-containing protein [Pirellulales bacterium]
MGCRTCRCATMLVLAWLAVTAGARAGEDSKEAKDFKNARRGIQQQMKSRKPAARLAAVRKLGDYPTAEAAKVLVQMGLGSQDDDVRRASYKTLLTFKDNQEVCDFLLGEVEKDIKRRNAKPDMRGSLAVLLASKLEHVERDALKLMEQAAASPEGGLSLLVSLVDELGAEGDEVSVSTLIKLSQSRLVDREFALRRSVVQALARVDQPDAVEALIDLLATVRGEVRADIAQYLGGISGEQYGLDGDAWLTWWEANREGFVFPPAAHRAIARAELGAKTSSSYYGLPVYAARLLFVIDTSASMKGARIEAAKRELIKAIDDLPPGVYFGVLVFNARVGTWSNELMVASPLNKRQATAFVLSQGLGLQTASYDALEAAFQFDAEAVYFLTDGAPYGGKIARPDEIVEVISRLNRARRVTFNSIGVGVGPEGNVFDVFLKTLAARNYGEYKRVDQ